MLLTSVNLLLRFTGTAFQVYIGNKIGAAGVGLLQLVMSVGMLAMTGATAGVRTGCMYLAAEELGRKKPENIHWVLSGCVRYSIVCSSIVSVGLFLFAPQISQMWIRDPETCGAIRIYAAFLPVSCLCGVMSGYFTAAGRIEILAGVEVLEQLFTLTITVLLFQFWSGTDPHRACEAIILGGGLGSCLTLLILVFLRLMEHSSRAPRIPVRRRLMDYAVPLAIADVTRSGISATENLMVPRRLGLYRGVSDPLAAFGTVCGMVFPVMMFPSAILFGLAELLIPELARCSAAGSQQRIRYLAKRSLRVSTVYGCVFCGCVFLGAEWLCSRLYGSTEASFWLRRFSLMIPMLYVDAITDAMTKGLGQQKVCVRYNIITSILDVVFLFFLLPRFGMHGYYLSFLITHGFNFLLSFRRLLQITQLSISWKSLCFCILITGVSIFIASFVPLPPVACGCFVLITGCLLFLFHVLTREDIRWLVRLIHP